MCMLIVKKSGVKRMPKITDMIKSWKYNSHGAGIAYSKVGEDKVHWVKGLMSFSHFIDTYEELPFQDSPEDYVIAIHFRYATQ